MARPPVKPPLPSRVTVPERANPLAKLVFSEMAKQNVTYFELEMRAGVLTSTFKAWRGQNRPGLESIEAALGSLGWALVPVPCKERVPAWVRDKLDEINAEWGREEPLLHRLLASACLAPILVEGGPAPVTIDVKPTIVSMTRKRKANAANPYQVSLFEGNAA